MTPSEIRSAREALGMTQSTAARLVGVDARTWRRWEAQTPTPDPLGTPHTARSGSSAREMPEPVQRLLRLCESPWVRWWLEEMAGE